MTARSVWITIIASVLSFTAGFFFANSLNRGRLTVNPAGADALKNTQNQDTPASADLSLTNDEIRKKIDEADKNPGNFTFQKNLGMSLYRYASMKQDAVLLPDALRIMERALTAEPADRELQIGIGNAYFDKGYFNKDNDSFLKSREFYRKALARIPNDTDVRADLALTYFLYEPPDLPAAVAEFEKGLEANPKHERALQFLTQTYIKQDEAAKAAAVLERLKQANPSNTAIGELSALLTNAGQSIPK